MPCPCSAHALLWPWRSSEGHGTEQPSRDSLWGICPRSASSGYHTEFQEVLLLWEAYQSCSQRSIPTTVQSGSNTLQKIRSFGLAVRLFPATTRTFTKDTALSEKGRGAAWHVWINGTAWQGNDIGMPLGRHGHGILCVNRTLHYLGTWCIQHYYRWCAHLDYQ